jgi:hypothetical protein
MDKVLEYCREWKLKCNLEKTRILVCKKGGNLRKDERWCPKDRTPETGVGTLENLYTRCYVKPGCCMG